MADDFAVFTRYEDKYILMHISGDRAEHIYVYNGIDDTTVGTIINCRAEKPMDNIDACFVQYAPEHAGFINRKIKGQTVLPLMLSKEAYDDKKAAFTDKLSIAGLYAVVGTGRYVKTSSRVFCADKASVIERFKKISNENNVGIILRTRAFEEEGGFDKAEDEIIKIIRLLEKIKEKSDHTPQYTVLYRPLAAYIEDILYLAGIGISEVVTDDMTIMEALKNPAEHISGTVNVTDRVGLRFYDDPLLGLCNLYGFNAKISEALSRKVWLKNGAYITIDRTESLYAVDVNSAGMDKKSAKEETFLAVNIEAGKELARQLVLRNISGMIVVDFINMECDKSYEKLEEALKKAIKDDRAMTKFIGFTRLKLCELTRSRRGKTLELCLRGRR